MTVLQSEVGTPLLTEDGSILLIEIDLPITYADVREWVRPLTEIAASTTTLTTIGRLTAKPLVEIETRRDPMSALYVGSVAALHAEFRNLDAARVDPDLVTIRVKLRGTDDWTTYTYGVDDEVSRLGTGIFLAEIPCTAVGKWDYVWISEDPEGVQPATFLVNALPT